MEFTPADAWQEFKAASRTEQGTIDDNGNEVVLGPRLNEAVRRFANGYLEKFEPESKNKATDERAKLLDLHWGRIEHDGAQLRGLGAAITNIAETLAENVTKLGDGWQGESYSAFAAAIAKVQRTLAEYGTAATTTGDGLVNAMGQARTMYQTFVDDTVDNHLNFSDESSPENWHRIGQDNRYMPDELAGGCPTAHLNTFDCVKDNDEQRNMIMGQFVSQRRWDILMQDGCEQSLDRVSIMYSDLKKDCDAAVERIKGKIDGYFDAVATTVDGVTKLYDAALGNVYNLANAEVFSSLRVIGGGAAAPSGGQPGPAVVDAPPAAVVEPVQPEPTPEPAPEPPAAEVPPAEPTPAEPPAEEPAAEEPPAAETAPAAAEKPLPPYTVQIQDGDRTLAVTSPPGEGTIRVTVTEGTGRTKSYELDFSAASGFLPASQAEAAVGPDGEPVEQVSARTDGKCVIQDGDVTITAERPLFSPDSLNLTVQDGDAAPTKYTLDFDDLPAPEPDAPAEAETPAEAVTTAAPSHEDAPAADETATETATETADVPAEKTVDKAADETADGPVDKAAAETVDQTADGTVDQAGATAPAAADGKAGHWLGEEAGSVSGVLVPDKADAAANTEAELPKADDVPDNPHPPEAPAAGEVGAGMPVMATPGAATGTTETGRAGSGWSVHGDLFDTGEPVYSMHGVLGDEDRSAESEHGTR
jgi:uncharacterized protein YukE